MNILSSSNKAKCWNCEIVGEYEDGEFEILEPFMKSKKESNLQIFSVTCKKCGSEIIIERVNEEK